MACSLGHKTSILISLHTSKVHFMLLSGVPALILDMIVELQIIVLHDVGLLELSPKILWSCSKILQQFYRREASW